MKIGKACAIFLNIDSPDYGPNEKGRAIQIVTDMATHNGVSKDSMLRVIKWLWGWVFSEESPLRTNGDFLRVMPDAELGAWLESFNSQDPSFFSGFYGICRNHCYHGTEIGPNGEVIEIGGCDVYDECPYGGPMAWWLSQPRNDRSDAEA